MTSQQLRIRHLPVSPDGRGCLHRSTQWDDSVTTGALPLRMCRFANVLAVPPCHVPIRWVTRRSLPSRYARHSKPASPCASLACCCEPLRFACRDFPFPSASGLPNHASTAALPRLPHSCGRSTFLNSIRIPPPDSNPKRQPLHPCSRPVPSNVPVHPWQCPPRTFAQPRRGITPLEGQ